MALYAVTAVLVAVWMGLTVHEHAQHPEYLIPRSAEVILLFAVLFILVSAIAGMTLAKGSMIFLSALAILMILAGVLFIPYGVPLIWAGMLLMVVAIRRLEKLSARMKVSIVGLGCIAALSMGLLFMAWRHRPVVECTPDGMTGTLGYWYGGGPSGSSGSSTSGPGGSRGSQTFDGKTYSWVCRGGEVVDFKVTPAD